MKSFTYAWIQHLINFSELLVLKVVKLGYM